jgi:hypothetical protein
MTEKEMNARIQAMMNEEYEALGGDGLLEKHDKNAIQQLMKERYIEQVKSWLEHDEEFKSAWCAREAKQNIDRYISEHQPSGAYREDAVLRLDKDTLVMMPRATRNHLIAWAMWESDDRNLGYIKSRLDIWDAHPECKTLSELENKI